MTFLAAGAALALWAGITALAVRQPWLLVLVIGVPVGLLWLRLR